MFCSVYCYSESNIDEITSLLKITPKDPELYFDRGYIYYEHEDFNQALEDFKTCTLLAKDEILYLFYRAMAEMKLGMNRRAIDDFKEVVKRKPDHAEALFYLGILHHKVSEGLQAMNAFERAIELKPDSPKYFAAKALLNRENGETDLAISNYEKALELDSSFTLAHQELSWIYFEKGELAKAINHASKLILLEQNASYFHTHACICSETDLKKAIESEMKALDLDNKNEEYKKRLDGYSRGISYRHQIAAESSLKDELNRKNEMEKIRREKIWEKIVKDNKYRISPESRNEVTSARD